MVRTRSMVRACMSSLCEDIIFRILLVVPVLSLIRFKSVCKLWHSIICDPRFIELHLAVSKKRKVSALCVANVACGNKDNREFDTIYIDTCESSFKVHRAPHPQYRDLYVGSCNGLVCLANKDCDDICLWNPSTKQYKILPTHKNRLNCKRCITGFGFDPVSSDYKFLRIVFPNADCKGELYSANADSWTEIQLPKVVRSMQMLTMRIMKYSPAFNAKAGVLYLEGVNKLLLFDLRYDVFRVCPYPQSIQPKGKSNVWDFNGSVAMIFRSVKDRSVLSLWTIEDICGKAFWTRKFNLPTDLENKEVSLDLGDGQFVVHDGVAGYTIYDYKKKENKKFSLPADFTCISSVVKFTESLVSLEGFKRQKYSGKRKRETRLSTCDGQKLKSFRYY